MFKGKGCNCDRCEEEFKRYHAKTGGSRADFRSMLHGKMVRVIDKYVRKGTGEKIGRFYSRCRLARNGKLVARKESFRRIEAA